MAKQRERSTQPSDINQTSAPVAKKCKPVRRSEEGLKARKESDRLRVKTRINISYSFTRWRRLKEDQQLRTDGDVANYLLNLSSEENSAKSRRREKGALSSSYEKRSSILMTSTGTCMQEPSCLGCVSASERGKQRQLDGVEHQSETTHVATEVDCLQDSFEEMEVTIDDDECNSVKSRLSDLDSDLENGLETTELSAPGDDDSCDEYVYVPIIPQRSTTSDLILECEEEELEPWQKHTLLVHLKEEDFAGYDQTDCKPEASSLQSWSACQHTIKPEAFSVVHTSEVHQISNNPVSLSSVRSPTVYATSSNQLHSDQSSSQTLSVPFSLPCFTVIKLESTGTSTKQ